MTLLADRGALQLDRGGIRWAGAEANGLLQSFRDVPAVGDGQQLERAPRVQLVAVRPPAAGEVAVQRPDAPSEREAQRQPPGPSAPPQRQRVESGTIGCEQRCL
jgi:hypothetical protein